MLGGGGAAEGCVPRRGLRGGSEQGAVRLAGTQLGGPLSRGGAAIMSKRNKTKQKDTPKYWGFFFPLKEAAQELPVIFLVAVRGGFAFPAARHAPWGTGC